MTVVGEALVAIKPDLSRFDNQLTAGLQKAVKPAAQKAGAELDAELGKAGKNAGEQAGEQFVRGADGKLRDSRGKFVAAGNAAGVGLGSGLETGVNTSLGRILQGATAVAVAFGLRRLITAALAEGEEAERATAQTEAVIRSTGNAANVSAKEIEGLATSLSKKVAIDDDVIQAGENMLLTFRNVRNETGKNNDIFNQAVVVSLDMSTAMAAVNGGQADLKSTSIQLGKALNDPLKGITALTRVGVTFDAQQKSRIAQFVAEGNIMGAQKVILAELRAEFEGSAEAQATGSAKLKVAIANLEESVGVALIPLLDKAAVGVQAFTDVFIGMPEPIQAATTYIVLGGGALLAFIAIAKKAEQVKVAVATMGKLGTAITAVGKAGLVAGAGVAAFLIATELLHAATDNSLNNQFADSIDDIRERLDALAQASDKELIPTFNRIVERSIRAKKALNELAGVAHTDTSFAIGSKLVERLSAFKTLAKDDYDAAVRLAAQIRNTGADTTAYDRILARVAASQSSNTVETERSVDQIQALGGTLDLTNDRLKQSVAQFGEFGTGVVVALGVPVEELESLAQRAANFSQTLENAVAGSTNPFSKFTSDAATSEQELEQFLVESQLAAATWASTIQGLIERGVEVGIIDQIAQAGPKSQLLLDQFVTVVDDKGVEWVNSVSHASDEAVRLTEDAYRRILVSQAIAEAERLALTKATQADIEGNTTKHLEALTQSNDTKLAQMASDAVRHLGEIRTAVDTLPTEHPINVPIFGSISASFRDLLGMFSRQPVFEGFAGGGSFSGWGLVGEDGPELVNVTGGRAQVFTAQQTRGMLSDGGGMTTDNSISIGELHMPVVRTPADAVAELLHGLDRERYLAAMT